MSHVTIEFHSDTNQSNAYDELDLLQLDTLEKGATYLRMSADEFRDMEEPVRVIVDAWGGNFQF